MSKNNCYIFWDEMNVYTQCEKCFAENKKGVFWDKKFLYGKREVKCNLCHTIIYQRKNKDINEDKTPN